MNLKRNGNGHGQGVAPWLKILLLVLAVVLVGFLLIRQVGRWAPRKTVWVATGALAEGEVVRADQLRRVRLRTSDLPEGALVDRRRIVGKRLLKSKGPEESFSLADLGEPGDPGSITRLVPAGRVMSTLAVPQTSIPYPDLRRGDRLEIVAVGRGPSGAIANDVYFVGWISPKSDEDDQPGPRASLIERLSLGPVPRGGPGAVNLLLALHPDDVIPVARAQGSGARLSLVLHGRKEVQAGTLLDLPSPPREKVELIAGAKREEISL